MAPSVEEVEQFLVVAQKDRQWLASELGCSRGTVNNWMSAGEFPEWGQKSLRRIMDDFRRQLSHDADSFRFTIKEWETIQRAMDLSGAKSIVDFCRLAIFERAQQIEASEKGAKKK